MNALTIWASAASAGFVRVLGYFHIEGSKTATEISDHDPVKLAVKESVEPFEAKTSKRVARSCVVLVIGPAESKWFDMGIIPSWETRPIVGFIV